MGIHSLIPHLKRVYPQHVDTDVNAPLAANVLFVDFMNALFTLTLKPFGNGGGGGGGGDGEDGDGGGGGAIDIGSARMTGAEAFERVSRPVRKWMASKALPYRVFLISDIGGWVPAAKKREQAARRVAQDKQAAKSRAAGTYMDFGGREVVFSDGGVACVGCEPTPFDGFSALHQRNVRAALMTYLRDKFAALQLPVGAELVIDMDGRDSSEALLVNARPHGPIGAGGTDATACTVSPLHVGHAWCQGRRGLKRPSARTGEAEILAIQYALQYARAIEPAAPGAPRETLCIMSADGDVVAAACSAFWDPPNGVRLLWFQRPGLTVDLTGLYAGWHRWPVGGVRPCTPEHIILALIAMGTDYTQRRSLFNWINEDACWDAICRFPLEILREPPSAAAAAARGGTKRSPKRAREAVVTAATDDDTGDDAVRFDPADFEVQDARAEAEAAIEPPPYEIEDAADAKAEADAPCQRVRHWRDVDRLVMSVYAAIGVTLKGADGLLPWTGSVDDHRRLTPGRIIRLYNELKQKRIAPPFAERPDPAAAAAAEAAAAAGGEPGGKRANAAKPLEPYRDACTNMLENLSYWLSVPRNEQRVDGVIA